MKPEGYTKMEVTVPKNDQRHPINRIEWKDVNDLTANDYNPNSVDKPEMDLLALSLTKQGWLQPILVWPDPENEGKYVIIDGFHRSLVTKTYKNVWAMTNGKVPVVVMDMTVPERMLLTIRINRAKGTHAAILMHEIVSSLVKDYGVHPDVVCREIGADRSEVDLLVAENIFVAKKVDEVQFSAAWSPKGIIEHGMTDV